MEDTYIFGDLHNKVNQASEAIKRFSPKRIIWIGDFLDSWEDQEENGRILAANRAAKTGKFLKYIIEYRPQDIIIQGNHDTSYRYPLNEKYKGWGFTSEKCRAFYSEFPERYWDKFKLIHIEKVNGQTVLFSHAGFSTDFFRGVFNEELFKRVENLAIANGHKNDYNPWLDSMHGPQWKRWPLDILDGVSQVVGHSTQTNPLIVKERACPNWNLCVDCFPNYIVKFNEQGFFAINLRTGEENLLKLCSDITQY